MDFLSLNTDVISAILSHVDPDSLYRVSRVSTALRRHIFTEFRVGAFVVQPARVQSAADDRAAPSSDDARTEPEAAVICATPDDVLVTVEPGNVPQKVIFAQDCANDDNWDTFTEYSMDAHKSYFMNAYRCVGTMLPFSTQFATLGMTGPRIPYFEVTVLEKGVQDVTPPNFDPEWQPDGFDETLVGVHVNDALGYMAVGISRMDGTQVQMTSNNHHTGYTWESIGDKRPNLSWGISDTVGCGLLRTRQGMVTFFTLNGQYVYEEIVGEGLWRRHVASQGRGQVEINFGRSPFKFSRIHAGNQDVYETTPVSTIPAEKNGMGEAFQLPWLRYKGKYDNLKSAMAQVSERPFGQTARLPSGHDYFEVTLQRTSNRANVENLLLVGLANPRFLSTNFGTAYSHFSVAALNFMDGHIDTAFAPGDIVGVAYHADTGNLFMTVNGKLVEFNSSLEDALNFQEGLDLQWARDLIAKAKATAQDGKSLTVKKDEYHAVIVQAERPLIWVESINFGDAPFVYRWK
ncbi:hypothetical protein BC830DRAFT_1119039 [Chytriomyces sp. MP71]|nr:hypothetical protein BC830DRAFT_1119039 [Chytriomyces sp. MP71]